MMFDCMKESVRQFRHIGERVEREFLTGLINPFADLCRLIANAFKDFLMAGQMGKLIPIDINKWAMQLQFLLLSGLLEI
jgi:hypothetical protein